MTAESPRDVAIENVKIAITAAEDILKEVRVQLDKLLEPEQPAETISCYESCDAQTDGLANALKEGWLDLTLDLEGRSWNYLGWCPACQKEHEEEERRLNEPKSEQEKPAEPVAERKTRKTLFDLSPEQK